MKKERLSYFCIVENKCKLIPLNILAAALPQLHRWEVHQQCTKYNCKCKRGIFKKTSLLGSINVPLESRKIKHMHVWLENLDFEESGVELP